MNIDLTAEQKDFATFLPALSGFYATFVGKQQRGEYVDYKRVPSNFKNGVESLNWLNRKDGQFQYHWSLYSAGHAELDINKDAPKEDMVRKRDRTTSWMLGDSGGFQIGKGVWEGDWKDPNCPKAMKKRTQVLAWMDAYMDYGMILDIPAWVARSPAGVKATGVSSYQEAVDATRINNDYFMKHRSGACKFLNVLQGENHADAEDWYHQMKDYCDPAVYPDNHFNGWSMGGQNMCDIHLVLKRLIALRFDGLLEEGLHDVMHFLGTSKLEWATLLTDVQRAVRKYHNKNFMITFDCASPFLATANGQVYCELETGDRSKWVYRMVPSLDDKGLSQDTTPWSTSFVSAGKHKSFKDSPLTTELKTKDVCIYGPGDLNKIGKEGKTSWDSFSYAIQMGHNVWSHINAVQEANRQYDNGVVPKMLVEERFDRVFFRDVVDAIFATDSREKAEQIIEDHSKMFMTIIGTRGATGKKTVNASTHFGNLFDIGDSDVIDEEPEMSEDKLDALEETL
jgi:hypothetical protein|tara:strand:- start:2439 stop:3968 length:1530 start_codon:yes stop_codon:yes gene_type:complete